MIKPPTICTFSYGTMREPSPPEVLGLQQALVEQAERRVESVCPALPILQQAQPIVFAHHLLAHAQSMLRDVQRLVEWDARTALSPLGAAAMAGSAIARRPEHRPRKWATPGRVKTRSTLWPAVTMWRSSCLWRACLG